MDMYGGEWFVEISSHVSFAKSLIFFKSVQKVRPKTPQG